MGKIVKLIRISALAVAAISMIASSASFAEKVTLTTVMPRQVRGVSGVVGSGPTIPPATTPLWDWKTVPLTDNNFFVGGCLGIGTDSPTTALEVDSANSGVGKMGMGSTNRDFWYDGGDNGIYPFVNIADPTTQSGNTGGTQFWYTPGGTGTTQFLMFIANNGNVGIGTHSLPGSKLDMYRYTTIAGIDHVAGVSIEPGDGQSYFGNLAFNREANNGNVISSVASAFQFTNHAVAVGSGVSQLQLQVYTPNASGGTDWVNNALVIDNAARVGIDGPTNSSYKFFVNGNAGGPGGYLDTTSDLRLKKNIEKLNNISEKIKNINGVKFDYRIDEFPDKNLPKGRQVGMIAQEMEKEFPELVVTDSKGYRGLAYDRFTAVLLEAVKEQQKEIDALKQEVSALKSKSAKEAR